MKKLVSTALLAFAVLYGYSGVSHADPSQFSDVSQTHWASTTINQAVNNGYIKGYANGTFKPSESVTRAEFASIVARAFDLPETENAINFTDVNSDFWAQSYIEKATRMGVIKSSTDSKFDPKTEMTRKEMATWITNALVASNNGFDLALPELKKTITPVVEYYKSGFSEVENAQVALMVGTGIMAGDQNGKFNPDNNVTRAEMVSILYRYLDVVEKDASSFKGLNEMREVGTTGTNMVTLANARAGKYNGKEIPFADNVIGKELNTENGSGTVKLHHYILIDSFNSTPTSIYAKMFNNSTSDFDGSVGRYTAFSDITFTARKTLSNAKSASDSLPSITGVGRESATLSKYGVTMVPMRWSFDKNPVESYYKAGVPRRGWVNPYIWDKSLKFYNGRNLIAVMILDK